MEMRISDGENVLEIGCGTGRNLIILARKYPKTNFFGLDASAAMLETAQSKINQTTFQMSHLKTRLPMIFRLIKLLICKNHLTRYFFHFQFR